MSVIDKFLHLGMGDIEVVIARQQYGDFAATLTEDGSDICSARGDDSDTALKNLNRVAGKVWQDWKRRGAAVDDD